MTLTCPSCGQSGELPSGRSSHSVRCRQCGTRVSLPSQEEVASQPDSSWYVNPVIDLCLMICLVVIVSFAAFLVRDHSRTTERRELMALKTTGDHLLAAGHFDAAGVAYSDLVARSKGFDDPDVREAAAWAIEQRIKVEAALQNLEAERQQRDAEQQREAKAKAQVLTAVGGALSRIGLSLSPKPETDSRQEIARSQLADFSTHSGSPSPTPSYGSSSYSGSSRSSASGGSVHVRGYYRKNGTYVAPYSRSSPSRRK